MILDVIYAPFKCCRRSTYTDLQAAILRTSAFFNLSALAVGRVEDIVVKIEMYGSSASPTGQLPRDVVSVVGLETSALLQIVRVVVGIEEEVEGWRIRAPYARARRRVWLCNFAGSRACRVGATEEEGRERPAV